MYEFSRALGDKGGGGCETEAVPLLPHILHFTAEEELCSPGTLTYSTTSQHDDFITRVFFPFKTQTGNRAA